MKKIKWIVAWLFGLYTEDDLDQAKLNTEIRVTDERRNYYQSVLCHLSRNGTLPPNTDLKMPKTKMILFDEEGEVLASNGKWNRLPRDNERVTITYTQNE